MSLVSPSPRSKPTISTPSGFNFNERAMDDKQTTEYLNEYTLFLLLEKQRNMKLRELYHGKSFANDQSHEDTLPKFPTRYQCLNLSAQWLVLEINKQRRDLSLHSSTKEQWKALDHVTKTFLEDVVNILRERYNGSSSQTRRSTPPCIPSLSPTAITPPSSPLTLPLAASEDSMLPQERYPGARRKEVDMSDDEIISLWNRAVPSVDTVDFDVCVVTTKKESGKK
mmetsp:Transcript_18048/g.32726  ORF Transcript_18048/g.32726 Transcript_18048/m.32726 type:complete len:225 (+) Transcript_18048:167-841(+)